MAIKDTVVHLNGAESGKAVVEAAIGLTQRRAARLIGLFAIVRYDVPI